MILHMYGFACTSMCAQRYGLLTAAQVLSDVTISFKMWIVLSAVLRCFQRQARPSESQPLAMYSEASAAWLQATSSQNEPWGSLFIARVHLRSTLSLYLALSTSQRLKAGSTSGTTANQEHHIMDGLAHTKQRRK